MQRMNGAYLHFVNLKARLLWVGNTVKSYQAGIDVKNMRLQAVFLEANLRFLSLVLIFYQKSAMEPYANMDH